MIDLKKAEETFNNYISQFDNKDDASFNYKVRHTYYVVNNSKYIAEKLNLSDGEILLAELIGLLHDIGRFEELRKTKEYNNSIFNHADYGSKILFEDGMIRNFIVENNYDEIIKKSIENHNKLFIEEGLDEKTLLFCKIIRDADKLDIYRAIKDEKMPAIFPNKANSEKDIEECNLSDNVYEAIINKKCINIIDRVTPLDYFVCVLAFTFDLNFSLSYEIVKQKNYINLLIDRFMFVDETKDKMENIRNILNQYVDEQINNK